MPSFHDLDFSSYQVLKFPNKIQDETPDPSIVWMLEKLNITNHGGGPLPPPGKDQAPNFRPLGSHVHELLETHGKALRSNNPSLRSTVTESFLHGRSQWIDEPIITKWREPSKELRAVLTQTEELYHRWSLSKPSPFDPFFDKLWMETADILRDAGLPWHNNNLNMPDETDSRSVSIPAPTTI